MCVCAYRHAAPLFDSLKTDDDRFITEMRLSDGYINATKMCTSAGKYWGTFWQNSTSRAYAEALSAVVHVKKGDVGASGRSHPCEPNHACLAVN